MGEGTILHFDTQRICLDPEQWGEDVDKFRPERWDRPNGGGGSFASIPLGGGHRDCMGDRFILYELNLFLCLIITYFDWSYNWNKKQGKVTYSFRRTCAFTEDPHAEHNFCRGEKHCCWLNSGELHSTLA